jgi:lipopolysaccharide transport system permease protein
MPANVLNILWHNRSLIWRLSRREIEARYRGSVLGLFWAVLLPLAMLGIYTLVFGSIFGARWGTPAGSSGHADVSFPLILFCGLILFTLFADTLISATTVVVGNASYVKKVVFPLEILPLVALLTASVAAVISFVLLLVAFVALHGLPPLTILAVPVLMLPLLLITLGLSYLLASLGVFLRDLKQILPPLTTAVLFLSPIFYSADSVPEWIRPLILLNPLTVSVETVRGATFWGILPEPLPWLAYLFASAAVFLLGSYWFTRTKRAFADVL